MLPLRKAMQARHAVQERGRLHQHTGKDRCGWWGSHGGSEGGAALKCGLAGRYGKTWFQYNSDE